METFRDLNDDPMTAGEIAADKAANADTVAPWVEPTPAPPTKRTPKPKRLSRGAQWAAAVADGQKALSDLQDALSRLNDLRSEYEEWKDNLPENLQSSALGEKLDAVCDFEFDGAADELEELLSNAESADLPLGFGRD